MEPKEVYTELPPMPVSDPVTWERVEVTGLVDAPLSLGIRELNGLPKSGTVQDFRCNDGWVATAQRWEGVRVSDVLERTGAAPEAGYMTFSCGEFSHTLTLEEARAPDILLALELNGRPLPKENGGPCRLLAGDRMGPTSVKWVQRIELTSEAPGR